MRSEILITIDTKNPVNVDIDDYDVTQDAEKEFHHKLSKHIESLLLDDEFEENFFEMNWGEFEYISPDADSFSDVADLSIGIRFVKEAGR